MTGRDPILNYRPGPDSELPLEPGEEVVANFLPDPTRYRQDHVVLAALFIVLVGVGFVLLGRAAEIWIGALGVILAIGFRYSYFRSEVFARRWRLTDRRLIGPQGRQVRLDQVKLVRGLMGDVQVVSTGGDKHLIRYQGEPEAVMAQIRRAARI
jgi:hypothetical protein